MVLYGVRRLLDPNRTQVFVLPLEGKRLSSGHLSARFRELNRFDIRGTRFISQRRLKAYFLVRRGKLRKRGNSTRYARHGVCPRGVEDIPPESGPNPAHRCSAVYSLGKSRSL